MRIIAGSAKGKRIEAPAGVETRPTLDRVREALFGAIQFEIADKTAVDLFSGSGALGLEAASRGAKTVYCNDRLPACAALIKKNAASCGLSERIIVWQMDYRQAIKELTDRRIAVDIAFLDAPYADSSGVDAATLLFRSGCMQKDGFIILEHSPKTAIPPVEGLMRVQWTRKYGYCALTMLKGESF